MPVIRHGDEHSLNLGILEHAAIVAASLQPDPHQLARAIEVPIVQIGDLEDSCALNPLRRAQQDLAADADADETKPHAVVGALDGG